MDEDRWDPQNGVTSPGETEEYGAKDVANSDFAPDVPAPLAQNREAGGEHAQPTPPAPEQRATTGGAVLPNNAQEIATDPVEESDIESFPASDPPAW